MAGYVDVYRTDADGFEGCINIASERLRWMLQYLTMCLETSATLQADATLDVSESAGLLHKYLDLIRYSDETVAEIGRLLVEGAAPSHPFWSNGERFFDPNYGPDEGLDPKTAVEGRQTWTQKAFLDVAALIQKRLERNR